MAAADLQQELKCCICFNIFSEPTTLPCGHTFCKKCIQQTFQVNYQRACPECRHRLPHGMELHRNTKMCNIIEHLNSTKPKPSKSQGGCSYCDGPAEKLCLDCETGLVFDHMKMHQDSAGHVLTDLSTTLQSRKCPIHKELLRYCCTEDGVNICASCGLFGHHKRHEVEKLSDLSEKGKSALKVLVESLTWKKAGTEKNVASVKSHMVQVVSDTELIRNNVIGVIGDLKKELESVEHQILCQVTTQEDQVISQLSQVIKTLESQISEINNQIREVQDLCSTTDPITLLEKKALNADRANALLSVQNDFYVKTLDVGEVLATLHSSLRRFTRSLPTLLKTRGFHAEDSTSRLLPLCQITKNVSPFSILTLDGQNANSPQFASSALPLFTGQYYWEVETSDKPRWAIGVSYHNKYTMLGYNADSWCLQLTNDKQYKATHGGQEVIVATDAPVKAVGVYLEYETGILSFYQTSNNSVRYLCSLHATFTQPLYMVTYVAHSGWVRIRK